MLTFAIRRAAVFGGLTLALGCSPDFEPFVTDHFRIREEVRIVAQNPGSTIVHSDRLEFSDPSAASLAGLEPGTVVVSGVDRGFLRLVQSASITDGITTLQTVDASLSDVIVRGSGRIGVAWPLGGPLQGEPFDTAPDFHNGFTVLDRTFTQDSVRVQLIEAYAKIAPSALISYNYNRSRVTNLSLTVAQQSVANARVRVSSPVAVPKMSAAFSIGRADRYMGGYMGELPASMAASVEQLLILEIESSGPFDVELNLLGASDADPLDLRLPITILQSDPDDDLMGYRAGGEDAAMSEGAQMQGRALDRSTWTVHGLQGQLTLEAGLRSQFELVPFRTGKVAVGVDGIVQLTAHSPCPGQITSELTTQWRQMDEVVPTVFGRLHAVPPRMAAGPTELVRRQEDGFCSGAQR